MRRFSSDKPNKERRAEREQEDEAVGRLKEIVSGLEWEESRGTPTLEEVQRDEVKRLVSALLRETALEPDSEDEIPRWVQDIAKASYAATGEGLNGQRGPRSERFVNNSSFWAQLARVVVEQYKVR